MNGPKRDWSCPISNRFAGFAIKGWCKALMPATTARALVVFDPLNIRYAIDSTNMQLWNTHNPFRALIVFADGYMMMWD